MFEGWVSINKEEGKVKMEKVGGGSFKWRREWRGFINEKGGGGLF